jgi:hypothetical protein
MAIFTADEIEEEIAGWKAALSAVRSGQSYTIAGRSLTRVDVPSIMKTLRELDAERQILTGKTGPHFTAGRVKR